MPVSFAFSLEGFPLAGYFVFSPGTLQNLTQAAEHGQPRASLRPIGAQSRRLGPLALRGGGIAGVEEELGQRRVGVGIARSLPGRLPEGLLLTLSRLHLAQQAREERERPGTPLLPRPLR